MGTGCSGRSLGPRQRGRGAIVCAGCVDGIDLDGASSS